MTLTRRAALAAPIALVAVPSFSAERLPNGHLADPALEAFGAWCAAYAAERQVGAVCASLLEPGAALERDYENARARSIGALRTLVSSGPSSALGLACALRGIVYAAGFETIRSRPGSFDIPSDAADLMATDFDPAAASGEVEAVAVEGLWQLIESLEGSASRC